MRQGGFPRATAFLCLLSLGALVVAAVPASAQTFDCKQEDVRPRAGSASVAQAAGESLQHKNWQPIGGLIEFTINSVAEIKADYTITTCFRWKVKKGEAAADPVEQRPTRIDLSNGGKLLKVTVAVPDLPETTSAHARAVWVVPLAEVRIVALQQGYAVPAVEARSEIGITRPTISLLLALAVIAAGLFALHLVVNLRVRHEGIRSANWLLRIISTPAATASLSQLQILLWTFVVAGATVYVATLSGQLVEITTGTLVLLGISGVTILASQAHGANQSANKQADADKAKQEAEKAKLDAAKAQANAAAAPSAVMQAEVTAAQDRAVAAEDKAKQTQSQLKAIADPEPTRQPKWSDLIVNEGADGVREVDVTRVQMLLFTLISAGFVTIKVIAAYVIPEIPVGYLALMGISNGVYVGSKVVKS